MKYRIIFLLALLALVSCTHDDIKEHVNFNVTLDGSNTYLAGEPVRFNIAGAVDNLLFYSGETGSQFKFKDRRSVPMTDVNSAKLELSYQARYGKPGGLDVYVSNTFDGLSGTDGAADRARIKAMVDGGMAGWTKLDYAEGASTKWTSQTYDLNDFLDNFTIAFHWHPEQDGKTAQRTYWLNGQITLDMEGTVPSTMEIASFNPVSVMMNEQIDNPYHKNAGNGSIIFNKPQTAHIIFQGAGPQVFNYALDGWVFSTPSGLNKVDNDKGTVIKTMQNYLRNYDYVYTKPGTYTVTFVGTNANYLDRSRDVKELKFNIVDRL